VETKKERYYFHALLEDAKRLTSKLQSTPMKRGIFFLLLELVLRFFANNVDTSPCQGEKAEFGDPFKQ
jgi:hypothetical protein